MRKRYWICCCLPLSTGLAITRGFLQRTAGWMLVKFLSDILQTALPEFQPYENSVEENESLSTYWQRNVATLLPEEAPSHAVDWGSSLQTEIISKRNNRGMLHTCRHLHVIVRFSNLRQKPPAWAQLSCSHVGPLRLAAFFGKFTQHVLRSSAPACQSPTVHKYFLVGYFQDYMPWKKLTVLND